jgi:ribonuclease P protein component
MERLKRRTDFRAAATGLRAAVPAFVLQARRRAEAGPVRIGFTVSRQVGNAVERNRVRRRLREIVRLAAQSGLAQGGLAQGDLAKAGMHDGHDYVLIGRRAALALPFREMRQELDAALRRIHAPGPTRREARPATGGARERSLHEAGSPRPDELRRNPRQKPRPKPRDA